MRIILEIPEDYDPFIEAEKKIVIKDDNTKEAKIKVNFSSLSIEIINSEEDKVEVPIRQPVVAKDTISDAINTSCNILNVSPSFLYTKTRQQEVVFARWLVWDYAINHLGIRNYMACSLFSRNHDTLWHHATLLNALNKLKDENIRYLSAWQREAHKSFWNKMNKELSLTNQQIKETNDKKN
jgi:hypothetical protein